MYIPPSNLASQNFNSFTMFPIYKYKDFQMVFYSLCFSLAFKIIIRYCLFLIITVKLKNGTQQADSCIIIPSWDMLYTNMLSCNWGFNWCNALLSYSFNQNINKMIQTAGM